MTHPPIQKTQKKQIAPLNIFLRKISVIVAYYLNMLHVHPTQVVFFRVFIVASAALYCFYQEDYIINLLGLALIILYGFLDMVDGDLARNHNQVTKKGGFLDANFDTIVLNAVILLFTLKFYFHGYSPVYFISGITVLFGTIFSAHMTDMFAIKFQINCGQGNDLIEDHQVKSGLDIMSGFFYRLITPRGFPSNILSNFRDYLLVGIIFDVMFMAILLFSIAINIRWVLLFILITFYYDSVDKNTKSFALIELMKKLEKI